MSGDPIEDDTDSVLMESVNEKHEIGRSAEPARGREVADGFISPRAVEGVLHDRKKFDVRETRVMDVFSQGRCHLAVSEPAATLFGHASPGAKMHLVDRN